MTRLLLTISLLLFSIAARGAEPPAVAAPTAVIDVASFELTDIDGKVHRPFESPETKAAVLVFISTDCPVANYYQPTLRKLNEAYAAKGVELFLVHANPALTAELAREHARQFSIAAPVVLDPRHALARRVGATKTPQAAVITRTGEVAYLGRIDDTYLGYGKKRTAPATHDLKDALDAVLAGKPVAVSRTDSVGCFIPFAKP
jgi:hypothetical protein